MAEKIIMPQGGQDLQFGTVVRWLKQEGQAVSKGELICEVETEKAVFEVNAPRDGFLIKIIKQDGEEAEVLSSIGFVGDKNEKVVFHEETQPVEPDQIHQKTKKGAQPQRLPGEKVRISPKARKLARDHGIDINALTSDRADGKITTELVQKVIRDTSTESILTEPSGGNLKKMSRVQRAAASRLSHSWQQAPHFFVTVSVDMTDVMNRRKTFNADAKTKKISINDLIIKAAALVLKDMPAVNASYYDKDTIILWEDIHIGIATSTDVGLLVPVLKNADKLSLQDIAEKTSILIEEARNGKLSNEVPSRFTISNLGMFEVDQFTAIINPPESAILAVASTRKKAVVNEKGDIVVRDIMEMTLSLDHRIGDGVLAATFINRIKALLEEPRQLF